MKLTTTVGTSYVIVVFDWKDCYDAEHDLVAIAESL